MNKVAIFGKKGSIAKYDITENKAIWVGNISNGYKPNIIGQYQDYLIVNLVNLTVILLYYKHVVMMSLL